MQLMLASQRILCYVKNVQNKAHTNDNENQLQLFFHIQFVANGRSDEY